MENPKIVFGGAYPRECRRRPSAIRQSPCSRESLPAPSAQLPTSPSGWRVATNPNRRMRLVIVSNRLPFTVSLEDGKSRFEASSGGLTTGLWSYLEKSCGASGEPFDYLWLGWPGATIESNHIPEVEAYGQRFRAAPVFLSEESA